MPPIRPKKKPNPKIRIVGHGHAMARPQIAARIRQSTLDRVDAAVEGPRYLALDYILAVGLAQIEQQDRMIEIDASELEEPPPSGPPENTPGGRK